MSQFHHLDFYLLDITGHLLFHVCAAHFYLLLFGGCIFTFFVPAALDFTLVLRVNNSLIYGVYNTIVSSRG